MRHLLLSLCIIVSFLSSTAQIKLNWWKNYAKDSIVPSYPFADNADNLYSTIYDENYLSRQSILPNGVVVIDTIVDNIVVINAHYDGNTTTYFKYHTDSSKIILHKVSAQNTTIWRSDYNIQQYGYYRELRRDKSGNYFFQTYDGTNNHLVKFSSSGIFVFDLNLGTLPGACTSLMDIFIDNLGNTLVVNKSKRQRYKISPLGQLINGSVDSCVQIQQSTLSDIVFGLDNTPYAIFNSAGFMCKLDSSLKIVSPSLLPNQLYHPEKVIFDSAKNTIYILNHTYNEALQIVSYSVANNDTNWVEDISMPQFMYSGLSSLYLRNNKLIITSHFKKNYVDSVDQFGVIQLDLVTREADKFILPKKFVSNPQINPDVDNFLSKNGNIYYTRYSHPDPTNIFSYYPNSVDYFKICLNNCRTEGSLSGSLFFDAPNTCQINSSTYFLADKVVSLSQNYYTLTDSSGYFEFYPASGTYQLRAENLDPNITMSCNPGAITYSGPGTVSNGHNLGYRFATNNTDIAIEISHPIIRPGFTQTHLVRATNLSNDPISGSIKLELDSVLNYVSASITPDSLLPKTLVWNFSTLQPLRSIDILVESNTTNGTLGKSYLNTASVSPLDLYPANNIAIDSGTVTGSYDPNDKNVFPSGNITEKDSVLNYTIRFQNTGTDTAFTVIVLDTIDTNVLDISTFKMISSSHAYRAEILANTVLRWTFNNILLPDSNTNLERSQGYINFTIKKKSQLGIGTVIANSAAIYFDFNEPVITNTATNTITQPSAINLISDNNAKVLVYPNPNNGRLTILCEQDLIDNIQITDLGGHIVAAHNNIYKRELNLELNNAATGIYFVNVTLNNGTLQVKKFIKN